MELRIPLPPVPARGRLVLLAALAAGACARQAPPPGGPPDLTAPAVLGVLPESLAVGVAPDAHLRIVFSERVDAQALERALWITPGGAAKPRIDGSTEVEVRFANPLPESTTVGVLLTTALRDNPLAGTQNRMKEPYRWIFSTGSAIWPGRVHGSVKTPADAAPGGNSRSSPMVLVALYRAEGDTVPEFRDLPPLAITQMNSAGNYDLVGLPVGEERFWLVTMVDRDGNREISGGSEYYSAKPETLRLTPAAPELQIPLRLVSPGAPGEVQGRLTAVAGDTTVVRIQLYGAEADSASSPLYQGQALATGEYTVAKVAPGTYRVAAYCDRNGDGRADEDEPWVVLGIAVVTPGDAVEMPEAAGPRCGP